MPSRFARRFCGRSALLCLAPGSLQQFAAALAPWLTREELDDRPHSVRLGAWVPLLYGGRKRRKRTRNIVFTPAAVISNALRNIGMHLPTPFAPLNAFNLGVVRRLHGLIADKASR